MASFPIFVDVGTQPPLVMGGSELALAKTRLLLKRAARVDVVATRLVPGFAELVASEQVVRLGDGAVTEAHVRGRPLVISATNDDDVDGRNSALARRLGVPVNVPDRPHLSTFSLGAIVDRGTVTVAIGTEGAAPVLATRLRADIEQSLHPRIGRLADIAREYRPAAAVALPPGAARRAFWDEVFSGEVARNILAGDETAARTVIERRLSNAEGRDDSRVRLGRVILVGAGPGDPELLTLKAVRALKAADVVVHDGLMGDGVLDYARREAQLISVAKAKGRHARTQAEINALLVTLARDGKTVVRLKGGDPSVFGRAGEEIDALRAAGIAVDVVPGITAATAIASSLQVPLTHRDFARSVTFLSGHAAGDGKPDFDQADFGALAGRGATLAVYMGLSTAPALAARLLADGWSPATPVIAVARVTQAGERRMATTLDVLASHATGFGLSGPALLIVGEVASLPMAGPVEQLEAYLEPSDAHCASGSTPPDTHCTSGANSSPSSREPVHA